MNPSGRRRGLTMFEVIVTSILLGAALSMIVPVVAKIISQRQSIDQQQWAVMELDNVLEDLAARPWAEITPETAAKIELSAQARERLPDAELSVSVADLAAADTTPASRKITGSLRWKLATDGWSRPVQLTAWVFEP